MGARSGGDRLLPASDGGGAFAAPGIELSQFQRQLRTQLVVRLQQQRLFQQPGCGAGAAETGFKAAAQLQIIGRKPDRGLLFLQFVRIAQPISELLQHDRVADAQLHPVQRQELPRRIAVGRSVDPGGQRGGGGFTLPGCGKLHLQHLVRAHPRLRQGGTVDLRQLRFRFLPSAESVKLHLRQRQPGGAKFGGSGQASDQSAQVLRGVFILFLLQLFFKPGRLIMAEQHFRLDRILPAKQRLVKFFALLFQFRAAQRLAQIAVSLRLEAVLALLLQSGAQDLRLASRLRQRLAEAIAQRDRMRHCFAVPGRHRNRVVARLEVGVSKQPARFAAVAPVDRPDHRAGLGFDLYEIELPVPLGEHFVEPPAEIV